VRDPALQEATALAKAGQLQEADGMADAALGAALDHGDGRRVLDWLPLAVQLCDALGRPSRAVQLLGVAGGALRGFGEHVAATAMEVDAALRGTAAQVDGWEARLEQAALRLADEGAPGWSGEAVTAVLAALSNAGRISLAAEVADRLATAWAQGRDDLDAGHLASEAARSYEQTGRHEASLAAWELAVSVAARLDAPEHEHWKTERERCRGQLLAAR
jgi:hypothetical protein